MTERRYTDEQFAEILRRATEMQRRLPARTDASGGTEVGPTTGMSLADMRAIAGEVGIDPELITRAAALVADTSQVPAGAGDKWVLSHSSAGDLTEDDRARILRAIRDVTGSHGQADVVGQALEWRSDGSDATRMMVTVEPVDGRNELRVSVDASPVAVLSQLFAILAGGLAGVVIGTNLQFGILPGIGILLGLGGTGFAVGRTIWKRLRRGIADRSQRIFSAAVAALPGPEA